MKICWFGKANSKKKKRKNERKINKIQLDEMENSEMGAWGRAVLMEVYYLNGRL